jgi:hypothetical protein
LKKNKIKSKNHEFWVFKKIKKTGEPPYMGISKPSKNLRGL